MSEETTPIGIGKIEDGAKPCPFCGKADALEIEADKDEEDGHVYAFHVYCDHCGCRGRNNYPIGWVESPEAALEAWNHRGSIRPGEAFDIFNDLPAADAWRRKIEAECQLLKARIEEKASRPAEGVDVAEIVRALEAALAVMKEDSPGEAAILLVQSALTLLSHVRACRITDRACSDCTPGCHDAPLVDANEDQEAWDGFARAALTGLIGPALGVSWAGGEKEYRNSVADAAADLADSMMVQRAARITKAKE